MLPSTKYLRDHAEDWSALDLVRDYQRALDHFYDDATGAMQEPARDDGSPAFLYSEVTGYAIQALLRLYVLTGQQDNLEKAKKSADWLLTFARSHHWIRTRYYGDHDSDPTLRLYSFAGGNGFLFDNGICLAGLAKLCGFARDERLERETRTLADRILEVVQPDGGLPVAITAGGEPVLFSRITWSRQSGSFHAKVAEGLARVWLMCRESRYLQAAGSICDFALTRQTASGRFLTDIGPQVTQLHPHCYSAEGLLFVGSVLGERRFVDAARRAVVWGLGHARAGRVPQEIGPHGSLRDCCRTDSIAQLLALGCRLYRAGEIGPESWNVLSDLARSVLSARGADGLFRYGEYEDGRHAPALNSWVNLFAFRGLSHFFCAALERNGAGMKSFAEQALYPRGSHCISRLHESEPALSW